MKVGACEWIFIKNRSFRTEIFAKFSNVLKKIKVKFELLELKIVIFSQKCLLWRNVTFFFQMVVL